MVHLLIIADDFTGALDTGVQFSSCGIETRVIVDNASCIRREEEAQVLVIDAETRHLSPEQAYEVVYRIVREAVKAGISGIYKKTDSALRGNIGSELTAALEASGAEALPFIPAFPKMNRITKGGIHYIDGVPVSQSVFGQDPFEPVTRDYVRDIVLAQRETAVTGLSRGERLEIAKRKGILVFDAETDEELEQIAQLLKEEGLCRVMAGCAGFAAMLPQLLGLKGNSTARLPLYPQLMVVCGSVNPITQKQLSYGAGCGYAHFRLAPEQKLDPKWWDREEGERLLAAAVTAMETSGCCMIDSNDAGGSEETLQYAQDRRMTLEDVRLGISRTLGIVAKKLLEPGFPATFLITGGDTLLGLMRQLGCRELTPVCELAPGSVLTKLYWEQREYHIITKSGGFGDETLLEQIMTKLRSSQV